MTPKLPPGRVLLNRLLTDRQRADLDNLGRFIEHNITITVVTNPTARSRSPRGYVQTGDCIHIRTPADLPVYDQAVAFLLLLRADPRGYGAIANNCGRTWPGGLRW